MVLVHTCIFSLLLEAINISSEKLVVRKMHLLNVCMKEERIYALFSLYIGWDMYLTLVG